MEETVTNLLSESIKGVPSGALLLLTVVGLVKYVLPKFEDRLKKLEEEDPATELALVKQDNERMREDLKCLRSTFDGEMRVIRNEFRAVWGRVGNRPEDKHQGGSSDG